jgi:hypothetical protein
MKFNQSALEDLNIEGHAGAKTCIIRYIESRESASCLAAGISGLDPISRNWNGRGNMLE